MAPLAAHIISTYNNTTRTATATGSPASPSPPGLIAVAFDQRNHGTRLVDPLHNEAWRAGNPRHAQDMFSCYHGTATDLSQLLDHLSSYLFVAPSSPAITTHLVLGISLGGHAAWHCLLGDPRITAGIVAIGCPDYTRLMADRARLSKRETFGASFVGSPDFPPALQHAVAQYDPAGLLLPTLFNPVGHDTRPTPAQLERFKTMLAARLQRKHILNLSGKQDKLVPYAAGEPFLNVLKHVVDTHEDLAITFEDVLFDGVGHAFPKPMADKATAWITNLLTAQDPVVVSKM